MKSIEQLKESVLQKSALHTEKDHEIRIKCLKDAVESKKKEGVLEINLEYLKNYSDRFIAYVDSDLYFAGKSGNKDHPCQILARKTQQETDDFPVYYGYGIIADSKGHYCPNYEKLTKIGIKGIIEEINRSKPSTDREKQVKEAYLTVISLFKRYIQSHIAEVKRQLESAEGEEAENLKRISENLEVILNDKPTTFMQGLQLVFLAHCYNFLIPYSNTIAFGNLDRVFYDLYNEDLKAGRIDYDSALEIICHFFLSFRSMTDDTQNIVLSGSDQKGNYFENDLSHLFMKAHELVHFGRPVPIVSLKIRPDTSDEIWEDALDLIAKGGGMPSFLNDELIRKALCDIGFDEERSNIFANIGCYEPNPYGCAYGGTSIGASIRLAREFASFFKEVGDISDYDSFLAEWEKYIENKYATYYIPNYRNMRECINKGTCSIFLGCLLDDCVERCKLPEEFGTSYDIFAVLFGGLGTLTDSLLCVKHFIYDTNTWTLAELKKAVSQNYPDENMLSAIKSYQKRFGTYEEESNSLAVREATLLKQLTKKYPIMDNLITYPGLFIFLGDVYTKNIPATPDGRKDDDRFSYGASASELVEHRDITKVLRSTAQLPIMQFPGGVPQTINLTVDMLKTKKGREATRKMVESYFSLGGFHLQINVADPEVLEDAQNNPEQYKDLLIRVSGHTEHFVDVEKTLQDALIERAKAGC